MMRGGVVVECSVNVKMRIRSERQSWRSATLSEGKKGGRRGKDSAGSYDRWNVTL